MYDPDPDFKPYAGLPEAKPERLPWWIAALAVILIIVALSVFGWLFLAVTDAKAHEAIPTAAQPQGWSYPFSCCSGYDCREVTTGPNGTVREGANGYTIASTGEVITYSDARIKNSPDGETHWCSVMGADDSRTICLFVPPKGF